MKFGKKESLKHLSKGCLQLNWPLMPRWVCEAMDGWHQTRSQRGSTRGPGFSVIQNDGSSGMTIRHDDIWILGWHSVCQVGFHDKKETGWRIKILMFEELRWLVQWCHHPTVFHALLHHRRSRFGVRWATLEVWRRWMWSHEWRNVEVLPPWDEMFHTFRRSFFFCCWCFWDIDITTPLPSRREHVPYIFYPPFEGGDDFEMFFLSWDLHLFFSWEGRLKGSMVY